MKKILTVVLLLSLLFTGCQVGQKPEPTISTTTFQDSLGREVQYETNPVRIAPCGLVAQMIIHTIAPELLVGWATNPDERAKPFIAEEYWNLPQFGQFYGKNVNLNIEALVAANPQVIIDLGDIKANMKEDLDGLSAQLGIPVIFVEATLQKMPEAYRTLGKLLNREERGEQLAQYCEKTLAMAAELVQVVPADQVPTAYYGTGADGLACNARGSIHAEVLDILGITNAAVVENVSQKGGGNQVDLEQVMLFNPEIILLAAGGAYERVLSDPVWAELTAVQEGFVSEIPNRPYDFLSSPPSVNRVIGVHWLAKVAYPDYYKLDLAEEIKTFYELFYGYKLTEVEVQEMLSKSK